MSLLLTKSCEYAILITIQQGKRFTSNTNVKIQCELDIKLPPSIDDLIPSNTTIATPIVKVDETGTCTFNKTLVYFISLKQLQRLRKVNSTITLTINQQQRQQELLFSMSDTKEVVYNHSTKKLDQIYQFVSDKGCWHKSGQLEIKIGLFYVQMPDNKTTNTGSNNSSLAGSFIHIRSPPPLPKNFYPTNVKKNKKNLTTILGNNNNTNNNNNSISSITTPSMTTTTTNSTSSAHSLPDKSPSLRRVKSSLVDLNIEELSDVLKTLKIFSPTSPNPTQSNDSLDTTISIPSSTSQNSKSSHITNNNSSSSNNHYLTRSHMDTPYHQIGKGKSKYTFFFQIIHVDHHQHRYSKKPFVSYTFLTKFTLLPTASISSTQKNKIQSKSTSHHYPLFQSSSSSFSLNNTTTCYYLSGHLVDIQDWLDHQGHIRLDYVLSDQFTKEIAAHGLVSLANIAYDGRGLVDKTTDMLNDDDEPIATVSYRIGIVSHWLDEKEMNQKEEEQLDKSKRNLTPSRLIEDIKKLKSNSARPVSYPPRPISSTSSVISSNTLDEITRKVLSKPSSSTKPSSRPPSSLYDFKPQSRPPSVYEFKSRPSSYYDNSKRLSLATSKDVRPSSTIPSIQYIQPKSTLSSKRPLYKKPFF